MPTASSMQTLIILRFIPYEKSTEQLQTIDLCVTNVWFTAYKAIIYSIQSYRLQHTKLSFMLRPIPTPSPREGSLKWLREPN